MPATFLNCIALYCSVNKVQFTRWLSSAVYKSVDLPYLPSLLKPEAFTLKIITMSDDKPRVTGVGGIFFKTADPEATKAERPARNVTVDSFYIAKFEVTQELFESVMGSSLSYFQNPQVPVNNLSWQQANYFVEQLNEGIVDDFSRLIDEDIYGTIFNTIGIAVTGHSGEIG